MFSIAGFLVLDAHPASEFQTGGFPPLSRRRPHMVLFTTAIFLFSPYNTVWSRSSMIEFAATFFGLAYLVTFVRWVLRPGQLLFVACLGLGILGCLAKATSFVIPLIVAATLGGLHFLPSPQVNEHLTHSSPEDAAHGVPSLRILACGFLLLAPLLIGYWYIHYGDLIKEQSPYTVWLSSRHPYTSNWTYGSWEERLHLHNWSIIWCRMRSAVMPSLTFSMILGWSVLPFCVRQFSRSFSRNLFLGYSLALAPLLAVFVFFNLFVIHTYYMIACAPFLALFAGAGFTLLYTLVRTRLLQLLVILFLIGLEVQEWSGLSARILYASTSPNPSVAYLSEAGRWIGAEERVIVLSATEWSSFAPYYLKRRAFMPFLLNKPVDVQRLLRENYFKKTGFRWLLLEGNAPGMADLASRIMAGWKNARVVPVRPTHAGYVLYALSDE